MTVLTPRFLEDSAVFQEALTEVEEKNLTKTKVNLTVSTEFVSVAKSLTGMGGLVRISGYVAYGALQGKQFSYLLDFQGNDIKQVYPPRLVEGKTIAFSISGDDILMKVDEGNLIVFSTLIH